MRTRSRKNTILAWIWGTAGAALATLLVYSFLRGGSQHDPLGMLLPGVAIEGLVALTIVTCLALVVRRRLVWVDVVRIICWTWVGCGLGLRDGGRAYFAHFWPQYALLVNRLAWGAITLGLVVVFVVSVAFRTPSQPRAGHCDNCGYSLAGLETPRCPECGCILPQSEKEACTPQVVPRTEADDPSSAQ